MTVQHNSGGSPSGTTTAVTYKNNITSGNLLLVAESSYDGVAFGTPTDTFGNHFTQLALDASGSSGSGVAIFAATANASGADTVSCNISPANNVHCHIYELEGVLATVDKTGTSVVPDGR